MSLNQPPSRFRLLLPADGSSAFVEVEEVDVTDQVAGLTLEAAAGRMPLLTLHGIAGGTVEGVGIVQAAADQNPAALISEFLNGIDASELERVALNRDDLDNAEACTTRAILRQLIDWASGG